LATPNKPLLNRSEPEVWKKDSGPSVLALAGAGLRLLKVRETSDRGKLKIALVVV
jgi:hypothetical protein